MLSKILSGSCILSLGLLALAELDKPVIQPDFPKGFTSVAEGIEANLPVPASTLAIWEAGWIPKACKDLAIGAKLSPFDVSTLVIQYGDCADPWYFCRHKDSPINEQTIADTFGRLPVRLRSFVRHMFFVPGQASAFNMGDNIQMNGDVGLGVYAHEAAHSLDAQIRPDLGSWVSANQIWTDAFNADSAVPDAYARTTQTENFAQTMIVALYHLIVPGGIQGIQPNAGAFANQVNLILSLAADQLTPSGQCAGRLENSEPVSQGDSAKFRIRSIKPNTALKPNTTVLGTNRISVNMKLY